MADAGERLQLGAGDGAGGDAAVGVRRGDGVGLAQDDGHRRGHGAEARRVEGLDDGRGDGEDRADAADRVVVAGVGHFRRELGGGQGGGGLVLRDRQLLLRLADPVVGMGGAEGGEVFHVHPRPGGGQGREPASREAGDAQAPQVHMGADVRVGLHLFQGGLKVAGAVPEHGPPGYGHLVEAVIARMVNRDHDVALLGHDGGEPGHHPRRAAEAVGEQDHRPAAVVGEAGVGGGGAHVEHGLAGRAEVQRLLHRALGGGVPDGDAHQGPVLGVAQGRGGVGGLQMAFAHRVVVGPGGGGQGQRRRGGGEEGQETHDGGLVLEIRRGDPRLKSQLSARSKSVIPAAAERRAGTQVVQAVRCSWVPARPDGRPG